MALNGHKALYFSSNFSKLAKPWHKHQIERMYEFCEQTGMQGNLAVELYKKPDVRQAFLLPLQEIFVLWRNNRPGIPLTTIRKGLPLTWDGTFSKGKYIF